MSRSLQARLLSLLGAEGVSQRAADLRLHASDAVRPNRLGMDTAHRAVAPSWVVWPQTVDQVQGLLQLANQERVPLVPYGGGTGLMGGALPVEAGIMVDFGRMNRIRAVSREDRSVTAEAGTVLKDLDQTLEPHGLMLGHDPWTYGVATVAGTISTNSLGYRGGYYGSMGEQVMGVEVVLPDGSLVTTKALPKFSTGLALAQLFIGTEGCYGIITAATLKTFPLPERRSLHYLRFPDFAAGFKAIQGMYDLGLTPMLMEYGEDFPMPAPAASRVADVSGETELYLGFEGFSELVDAQVQRARALCASHGGVEGDRDEAERFWNERHRSAERFVQQRAETGLAPYLQAQQGGPAMDYLHVTVPAGRVLAYRRRIVQVLGNLLSNAAKHSSASSVIRISAVRQDVHVAVSVADEGRGIPSERLPGLFRKFSRMDAEDQGGDTGLGFAICKGIVEAHGGRIWAESEGPGMGAREVMSLATRSNCFLVMMAENAFSTLTGVALSLAFVPQTKVPV